MVITHKHTHAYTCMILGMVSFSPHKFHSRLMGRRAALPDVSVSLHACLSEFLMKSILMKVFHAQLI